MPSIILSSFSSIILSSFSEKYSPLPKNPFTEITLSIAKPYLLLKGLIPPVRIYPIPGRVDKPIGKVLLNLSKFFNKSSIKTPPPILIMPVFLSNLIWL